MVCLLFGCREPNLVTFDDDASGGRSTGAHRGAGSGERGGANDSGATTDGDAVAGEAGVTDGGRQPTTGSARPPLVTCADRPAPDDCRVSGDSTKGVRLIGTLLEPLLVRARGTLDLDANGNVECAACDCGDDAGKLVIDCPGLVVSPGLINLHDHLTYAGTAPVAHPGELYQHRNDWRLGQNGHTALAFAGGATAAQVLAQELRQVMAGATSTVGAGGRRGLLRNLEVAGSTEALWPGDIRAETFPLDDASGNVDSASCSFGKHPDTPATAAAAQAYVAHVGEGTNQQAEDELRCALGDLHLLGENSAVVHAMALSRADAVELSRRGASVVWSPRSNLDLYGSTAPVALLASLGVRIALGTDWLASGSMNLLRELDCARKYDTDILNGYFDDFQLWRMVTEHPAWALGLEGRFGALQRGLVGDVAVFAERGPNGYASLLEAQPADVKLVLRAGKPLYGDDRLVSAFHDGDSCDGLAVCGATKRVCTAETGLTLAAIQSAGEAVYPLFSCATPPPNEPNCSWIVNRECPIGEAECEPPEAPPDWDVTDVDHDGVPDAFDLCPRLADPDQRDGDNDGRGDACDPCPVSNPGLSPCSLRIAELRAPELALTPMTAVTVTGARVTAVRVEGSQGFYVEDGDHAPYSGIFVYGAAPKAALGEQLDLQGYFSPFAGTDELVHAEVLTRTPLTDAYAPLLVAVSDLADGSARAAGLASQFVRIEDAVVETENPDFPKDYDETLLQGALRLDDLICADLDNQYPAGTQLSSIQGIAGFSFDHRKLYPRTLDDLTQQ